MSTGDVINFYFKIVNETKRDIDGANVTGKAEKIKTAIDMIIVDESKLTFRTPNNLKLSIFGIDYIFDDSIYCTYKSIKIKFSSNKIAEIKSLIKQSIGYIDGSSKDIKSSIVDINDYMIELEKIKLEPDSKELLCLMLFGVKRFGDWAQAKISKDLYLGVKTDDYFMKAYLVLSGAPIIINDKIYNWKPAHDMSMKDFRIYKNIQIPQDQKFNFYGIDVLLNRYFFLKYIKYKTKYNKLKKFINIVHN